MIRKLAPAAAVAALSLVLPASASADVSCSYDGVTRTLSVTVTDSMPTTPQAMVTRDVSPNDQNIVVSSSSALANAVACAGGTPTVSNTDLINIDETATTNLNSTPLIDLRRGNLAPGADNEADDSDEIEINLEADASGFDRVAVTDVTATAARNLRFGDLAGDDIAANLNGDEASPDVDLTATGLAGIFVETGSGNDTVTADGGPTVPGSTGPLPIDVSVTGNNGGDTVVGGNGTNSIFSGDGDDTVTGGVNSDNLQVGGGNDTADGGGSNADFVSYLNHNQAVAVDLRLQGGPQDTGGAGTDTLTNFESVLGSNQPDTLIGDDGPNSLSGGQAGNDPSADTLIGLGGTDTLIGWRGDDLLIGGAGDDSLIGGVGSDTVSYESGSTGAVSLSLDFDLTGDPQNTGGAGVDTLSDSSGGVSGDPNTSDPDDNHEIENIVGSPFADDNLTGSAADNVIRAYDGLTDTVSCGGGSGDLAVLDDLDVEGADPSCETADNAPRTSIAAGPADGSSTNNTAPTYDLSADKPATFERSVDGGPFVPCTDPCTVPALAPGGHTVAFRATDTDGNDNPELTPIEREVTIDVEAPVIQITSGPPALSNDNTPTWEFASSDPSATIECRIGFGAHAACSGPGSSHTPRLADGPHAFEVRAVDAAGNVSAATGSVWVDTRAPDTTANGPEGKTTKARVRIKNLADEGSVKFECKLDKRAYKPCGPTFSKKVKVGKHKVRVRATDLAGNTDPTPAVVRWRRIEK